MHHAGADEVAIEHLITDDMALQMVTPSNADGFRGQVLELGCVPEDAQLRYEHAPEMLQDWLGRQARLAAELTEHPISHPLHARLWEETMREQATLLTLAIGLSKGLPTGDHLKRLYGEPSREAFWMAVGEMSDRAAEGLDHDCPLVRELAGQVGERLPEVPGRRPESDLPDLSVVDAVRAWFAPIAAPWLEMVDCLGLTKGVKANAGLIAAVFADILGQYDLGAVVTDEVTSITFQPSQVRLAVPPRRQMTAGILAKTVVHEMVHILRYLNGTSGALALGQFGLPGYLPFEEGAATALAEIATSKKPVESYARPEAYVAIGLASGLDPNCPEGWSPDRLFQLMWRHYTAIETGILAKKGEVDKDAVQKKGMEQAATRVLRTFRGVIGGGACTRDLSYRDGSYAFWRWTADHSTELDLLLRAKANLADPSQYEYAKTLT